MMGLRSEFKDRPWVAYVVLLVTAALPAVSPNPYPNYPQDPYPQPSYPQPEYPSYPAPEYQPSYPSYPQSYPSPAYPQSYPSPAYPSYPSPAYPSYSPSYPSYTPPYVQYAEYDNYEAVTYLELNESIHCGVLPSTNDELYLDNSLYQQQQYGYGQSYDVKSVQPYAKSRWNVHITDDYYNYVCTGVIVHKHFILTSSACVYGPLDKYRVRLGDWDIQTDYNEYEAWKNFEARICKKFPVKSDPSYGSYPPPQSYGYNDYSDLVLLEIDNEICFDKYPQVAPICLPVYPSYYPSYPSPAYPSYPSPAYPSYPSPAYPSAYPAQPYVAPSYTPSYPSYPSYPQPSYYPEPYYSECWVVGWYAPPTTDLKNHPKPTPSEEYNSYGGGYQKSYNPEPKYYEEYYKGYDQSRVLRRAKVKEIKCPAYGYGQGQGYQGSNSVCYVGVEGHDTCVADKGAGVYCVVDEKYPNYESGYSNYDNYQPAYLAQASYPDQSYSYEQNYYKKEIKAIAAAELPKRKRGVLVAIVQKLTQCSEYPASYGGNYQQQQSKPITATKVDYQAVDRIIDIFWENAFDHSCPATKPYYQEPVYQQSYPSYPSPAYPSYPSPAYPSYPSPAYPSPAYPSPAYPSPAYNSYEPQYQSYPAVYEPSYPSYDPPYPYEPAYPSYPAPAYPAPAYPSYPQPSYGYNG